LLDLGLLNGYLIFSFLEIKYKYESARLVVMSISIAIVGGLLIALSLMDLPWGKITGFLWRDREEHEKNMKEKEEKKKPKRDLKNEKVDSRKLMASEQEMLNRFKSALNNNRQKSSMVLPNQVAQSNF
jgi:hypothetical protein